ncbi:MAG: RIP metalloprotease RseP [Gemmatimonadota bacterium]|nr:RIP metalloprotease RseP [Gemmatimonadota bacterium]
MLGWVQGALATVFVFGLVVFIHELGHFLAAKAAGVYAPRFSIGFGPALWSRKWGETEYVLAWIPLGGYVRMASREDDAMAAIEGGGERPASVPGTVGANGAEVAGGDASVEPAPRPKHYDPEALAPFGPKPVPPERMFESKSLAARLMIMLAGVTMNVVLGFIVLVVVAAVYGRQVIRSRAVGAVRALPGLDLRSRIGIGDTVLAVDGAPARSWNDVDSLIYFSRARSLEITTQRATVTIPLTDPSITRERVASAILPLSVPRVGQVKSGSPASRAGMLAGDSVTAVAGKAVRTWEDVVALVRASPEQPLIFSIVRSGRAAELSVRPESTPETDERGIRVVVGKIGVYPPLLTEREPIPLSDAVRLGWGQTWQLAGMVGVTVKQLVTGQAKLSSLGGPVAIAGASAEAARQGFDSLLRLLALLSINVAVLNLLPIPILDGGQILINVIEAVRGGSFSIRTREYIIRFGLITIAILFVIVMFNDIRNRLHF